MTQFINIIPSLTIAQELIFVTAICVIGLIAFGVLEYKYWKKRKTDEITKKTTKTLIVQIITGVFVVCSAISICNNVTTIKKARTHGMFQSLNEIKWEQALKALQNTPVEDNIEGKDLKNSIILYYKFGCPDCDAVFALEKNYFKNNKVYWVSTRSKQGKKLLEKYPVQEVPWCLYRQ